MEKVVRRTKLAINQANRRGRLRQEAILKAERRRFAQEKSSTEFVKKFPIALARQTRREDWELGPLAPWRDPAVLHDTFAVSMQTSDPELPRQWRAKEKFIRQGDRVCVIRGRAAVKGKIGKVTEVDYAKHTVKIENVNVIEAALDSSMRPEMGGASVVDLEGPLSISDVQLVFPLPDPSTGVPRDCLIANLEKRDKYFDRFKNRMEWSRYLMPQNIKIPWPAEQTPEYWDEPGDTVRIDLEDTTYIPTLITPPMPESVIDELRNRTSRFRSRHSEEYIRRKTQEGLEAQKLKEIQQALKPSGAKNMARRPRVRAGSQWNEVMETVGRHMANKRPAVEKVALDAASTSPPRSIPLD